MKRTLLGIAVPVVLVLLPSQSVLGGKLEYPETKRIIVTDEYHGTKIEDPYRWLEDDYAEETTAWVESTRRSFWASSARRCCSRKLRSLPNS